MNGTKLREILIAAAEHHRAGRLDQAVSLYEEVLSHDHRNADACHLLGLIAHQRGDQAGAMRSISRAIAIQPREATYYYHLGMAQAAANRLEEAQASYRSALRFRPDNPEAHNNLGLVLARRGLHREAQQSFESALRLRGDFVEALLNLGNLHRNQGGLEAALACYEKALALNPNHAGAHNSLGNLKLRQGRLEEAAACYCHAAALNPSHADPANNLGGVLMQLGRHNEALEWLSRALSLSPDHAGTHLNKAWLLLLTGNFAEGWREYEWRLRFEEQGGAVSRWLARHAGPPWAGTALAHRSILVHCEQGLGDTIQFARYLPMLKKTGARVLFCCQRELVSLMKALSGPDLVLKEPIDGKVTEAFDDHVALLSLPGLLDPDLSNMPHEVPYLHLESGSIQKWRSRLRQPGLKVGIVWAGKPTNQEDWRRSCKLTDFAPLCRVEGVFFFSLQKGPAAAEIVTASSGMNLIDLSSDLLDFADTAAAIQSLDLVIAVDTAVAHLAGALAKPVWTLLPFFPDWRWQLVREDSSWYPTMRLFRQPQPGDWPSVFARIAMELQRAARQDPQAKNDH